MSTTLKVICPDKSILIAEVPILKEGRVSVKSISHVIIGINMFHPPQFIIKDEYGTILHDFQLVECGCTLKVEHDPYGPVRVAPKVVKKSRLRLNRVDEQNPSQTDPGHARPSSTSRLTTKPDGLELPELKSPSRMVMAKDVNDLRQSSGNSNLGIFTYNEMRIATQLFGPDQVLGEGGFGVVYKGVIDENVRPGYTKIEVAIKKLNREGMQGEPEWLAEINFLGQLQHPNLVKLIGYCCEEDHRLLVYEYMASGSLEDQLFPGERAMTWSRRMKIALDAAKGLAFLHNAERPIIYRDLKTAKILLDADFNAKISDFGLAKEGPVGDQTHVPTRVMGTYGYAAPEYCLTGRLTTKSDVYAFGVVLLEMLIGRTALDTSRPNRQQNPLDLARPLVEIFDRRMRRQYSSETADKVANLAYQCLRQNPKCRPVMNEVVEILETIQTRDIGQASGSGKKR